MTMPPYRWTPQSVSDFWSEVSDSRLAELNFSRVNADRLMELITPSLPKNARILDYGAGDGHLIRTLIDAGYATGGTEFGAARNLSILAADLQDNPLFLGLTGKDSIEKFDVIIMIEVVEHVLAQDLPLFFDFIRAKLEAGGSVIVTTPNSEDLGLASSICPHCHSIFHRWQHVRSFDRSSLQAFLAPLNLETVALDGVDFTNNRHMVDEANRLAAEAKYWRSSAAEPLMARLWQALQRMLSTESRPKLPDDPTPPFRHLEGHLFYVGRKLG